MDENAEAGPSSAVMMAQNGSHVPQAPSYEASLPPSDALPYYDDEISKPGMQAKVERLLAAEMGDADASGASNGTSKRRRVAEDRLPPPIELFAEQPHLRAELDRIAAGNLSDTGVDKTRYQLAEPDKGADASEEEWTRAISNAEAQLMHSEGRITNLELLKKFGANHWRLHNFQQEAFVRQFEAATQRLQAETATINRARKQEQSSTAGPELTRLSKRWAELLNRSLSVELANVVAAAEIEDLEFRRDALKAKLAAAE